MSPAERAIVAVWRLESARLLGGLVRRVGDLDLAEDLAQHALLMALERWPEAGIPDNPGAWLMTTARNHGVDRQRRAALRDRKHATLLAEAPAPQAPDLAAAVDDAVGDDLLRLILIACHPLVPREGRVALTLRLLGGLTTPEIARAFLTPEATIAQRIVRAKRTLAEARIPFEVPRGDALAARVASALEVIYLIFNEGYAATRGDDWLRPALCEDALRLGRVLAALVPDAAEAHGLLALMELQASRFGARTRPDGTPVPLLEQRRSRWDQGQIRRGLDALARAEALAAPLGPYTLQAAIAACHARARTPEATDWARIVALYDALAEATPSPVIDLNRAMAVGMAFGPAAGLALLAELADALAGYPWLPAAEGELRARLGQHAAARAAFARAAALTQNAAERAALLARATPPPATDDTPPHR